MEKSCPGQEGHPPSRVNFSKCLIYEKKVDPFARVNSACACSDHLALSELTRLGEPKLARLLRVTLPSKERDPARRVTLLAEPTFCFSCKRFIKFRKEMKEKLAHPG